MDDHPEGKPLVSAATPAHGTRMETAPGYGELGSFIRSLPEIFGRQGEVIYKGRNELRLFRHMGHELVVKSYRRPHLFNRLVYALFRPSKAERAYRYGLELPAHAIGTPQPIGWLVRRSGVLISDSYSVTLRSTCPWTYRDFAVRDFERRDEILKTIALTSARMHEAGLLHNDYSAGNILFDDSGPEIRMEIIDLNRIVHGKVGMEAGCRNFERLPGSDAMLEVMAREYARLRGFNEERCVRIVIDAVRREEEYRAARAKRGK